MKILAVCMGNICRSPAAAAAIRAEAARAGVEVEVDSAGTGAWNLGEGPHPQSVAAGARVGLDVSGRARRMTPADFERFDIIVVMDSSNLREIHRMAPTAAARAKVRLFRTYDLSTDDDQVPDPWGGTDDDYDEMIRMVTKSAEGLVSGIHAARNPSAGVKDPVPFE